MDDDDAFLVTADVTATDDDDVSVAATVSTIVSTLRGGKGRG